MNAMTTNNTGIRFNATKTVPMAVFQDFFVAGPRTLGRAIQAAIDRLEVEGLLKPLAPDDVAPFAQARAVLALLADCYARQVYRSSEVAMLAARDPDFPWLWWEELPDAHTLHRFCRENHAAIHRCLLAALYFLAEQKILAGAFTKIDGPQLTRETSRRITMAAFADSMEFAGA